MAKPSIHKLLLTFDEYHWVVKTIQRKAQMAQSIEKDKRLKEMVIKFAEKFTELPLPEQSGDYLLKTNRIELRFLAEITSSAHAVHVTKIIPEYADRMRKDPSLKSYYETAVKQTEMLLSIRNKIGKVL